MISLHKLGIFLAVAQEGKISKAANRLLMTQAAVSQHIQDLEASLGVTLFERSSQGVSLTPAGQTLMTYARQILHSLAEAESAVTNVKNLRNGTLILGFTPHISGEIATEWLTAFYAEYPSIHVKAHIDTTRELLDLLQKQRLDLIFVEGEIEPHADLEIVGLQPIRMMVAVSARHPWAERQQVSIYELAEAPYLARSMDSHTSQWTNTLFAQFQLTPNIIAEFNHPLAIKRAILQGMGVSLLPECFLREEHLHGQVKLLSIREIPDLHRMLRVAWMRDMPLRPIPKAFLRLLGKRYPHLIDHVEPSKTY